MPTQTRMEEVRKEISTLSEASCTAKALMQGVCELLHARMLKYNWVGFYILEPGTKPGVLVLESFVGAMTPHTRIPAQSGHLWRRRFQWKDDCR